MNPFVELLLNHPETVTAVRIALVAAGTALAVGAVAWRMVRGTSRALLSDRAAVRLVAVALVVLPLAGLFLSGLTRCDFIGFQTSASLLLVVVGTHLAFRAKEKWYILVYVVEFLLFGSLCPAI